MLYLEGPRPGEVAITEDDQPNVLHTDPGPITGSDLANSADQIITLRGVWPEKGKREKFKYIWY